MTELIVDSFAGGGGASTGIEMALGRSPDLAINHDAQAIAMHAANHPGAVHLNSNIYQVDPLDHVRLGSVGLAWFSPDCKHFSKAKGGKPVAKNIRDLAWVVALWAKRVRPRVIVVENVEEFQTWGPLGDDNRPDQDRKGETFRQWVKALRGQGYRVEWRELKACDFGAPTIRRRLFVIARCDGRPIVWPEPTHAQPDDPAVLSGMRKPYRTAAEIIDWSMPCPSIFLTPAEARKIGVRRPLADNTLKRIAHGIKRYVLDAENPFIVPGARAPGFVSYAQHRGRNRSLADPLHTLTASTKDHNALILPHLHAYYGPGAGGQDRSADPQEPLRTVTTENRHALVAAFLAQHNTGVVGHDARTPVSTITQRGTQQAVIASHMLSLHGTSRRSIAADMPLSTITAGGGHAAAVVAFLQKYFGTQQAPELGDPLHTVTTRDRFGVVTVQIDGQTYTIADIGMRMLTPREGFRAMGFPDSFKIDADANGKPFTKTAQTRMCGNAVCPPVAAAIVDANVPEMAKQRAAA